MNEPISPHELAQRIDHTLLKPEAQPAQIDRLCDEAIRHDFRTVCVNPVWVARCAARLAGQRPRVCTVAGFPLGASHPATKAAEARQALDDGAAEIDMVLHYAALIAGDADSAVRDVATVLEAVRRTRADALLKVILETAALTNEQIALGCRCAASGGADFVKTSTGFHAGGGATLASVALMKTQAANMQGRPPLRVKASGGIRDLVTARAMIAAGAERLGTSSGVAIVEEAAGGAAGGNRDSY